MSMSMSMSSSSSSSSSRSSSSSSIGSSMISGIRMNLFMVVIIKTLYVLGTDLSQRMYEEYDYICQGIYSYDIY